EPFEIRRRASVLAAMIEGMVVVRGAHSRSASELAKLMGRAHAVAMQIALGRIPEADWAPSMPRLADLDAVASAHLPDPETAGAADTLDQATDLVSRNIYPHRLRVADGRGRGLMCLTSALDLGDCALGYVQYGFDVEIDPGVISEFLLVKSTV